MDLGLRDRAYLVTGGSRGLGFVAARALVADGARGAAERIPTRPRRQRQRTASDKTPDPARASPGLSRTTPTPTLRTS
jgi:NAD(P)-dependent dehydrogenase (short-subunit alcohol dehydrogenase family)